MYFGIIGYLKSHGQLFSLQLRRIHEDHTLL